MIAEADFRGDEVWQAEFMINVFQGYDVMRLFELYGQYKQIGSGYLSWWALSFSYWMWAHKLARV